MSEEKTYYQTRQELYGITEEMNRVMILKNNATTQKSELSPEKIFVPCERGIEIYPFTLDRNFIRFAKEGSRWKKNWCITRLEKPMLDKKGNEIKYLIPKGSGSYPFIPEQLIDKFEKGTQIDTLILTEGYYKAFKGAMHGFDIIGLTSITHYKDRDSGAMHQDVIRILKKLCPKRIVWLVDGDCLNLSTKAIEAGKDLYTRPNQFFNSAHTLKRLFEDYDVEKIFAHVRSDAHKNNPKGLDDLMIEMKALENEVVEDFNIWGKPNRFFEKIDMTFSSNRVRNYFHLTNVNDFIAYHIEHGRQELKQKEFLYNGTLYKWDDEKGECKIMSPADAKKFFRVGDQYHEKVAIPNKYGQLENTFHRRMKSTITDDYGKKILEHVAKYKAFAVVPDHVNYQEVIHNCFNLYFPFEHEPEDGDCPATLGFLQHIFGSGIIKYTDPKDGKKKEISELDLGLDYIQLLYKMPTQTLPILCLVSRENNTGKSTLAKWLKLVFMQNVAIVGNAELSDNFNASWASKLLVICDEAKIDKMVVVEKVKSLSTADKIFMNAKGKDHVEIDFFAKFLFLTNNEDNFIYASEDDVRYWVRKIAPIKELNINILADMRDEIPAFLHFLDKRKMVSEQRHRAWFHPQLLKTDALKKVIAYSQPTIEKEIRQKIRDMFFDFPDVNEIFMSKKEIKEEFFRNKNYEDTYIQNVLQDRIGLLPYYFFEYKNKHYSSVDEIVLAYKEVPELEILNEVKKINKPIRYEYYRWNISKPTDSNMEEKKRVTVKCIGRPYVFPIDKFLTADEIASRRNDPEMHAVFSGEKELVGANNGTGANNEQEDLPF